METSTKLLIGAGAGALTLCALLFIGHIFLGVSFTVSPYGTAQQEDHLSDTTGTKQKEDDDARALIGGEEIMLEVADTDAERRRGLSGRDELASTTGMLFIFDESDRHGIWMKEMNFPIDIIWLNEAGNVVDLRRRVSPETFPRVFQPDQTARYVLETVAGAVDNYSLSRGDKIEFVNISQDRSE